MRKQWVDVKWEDIQAGDVVRWDIPYSWNPRHAFGYRVEHVGSNFLKIEGEECLWRRWPIDRDVPPRSCYFPAGMQRLTVEPEDEGTCPRCMRDRCCCTRSRGEGDE